MKTPEEIKKGLERCKEDAHCNACASSYHCQIEEDALAYIQQLEEKVSKLEKRCDAEQLNATYAINELKEVKRRMLRNVEIIMNTFPKWISVEERLPEVSGVALVIANVKPKPHITLRNAYLIASYWADEGWIADGFEGWDALQVTYWMPLPEPPEED